VVEEVPEQAIALSRLAQSDRLLGLLTNNGLKTPNQSKAQPLKQKKNPKRVAVEIPAPVAMLLVNQAHLTKRKILSTDA